MKITQPLPKSFVRYLQEIGRKGGSVKSPAKAASSRANALLGSRKGGRPKGAKNKAKRK